jgi:drug/metabolite transporter (DMT)-like permease
MICISRAQAQGSMLRLIAIMTTVSALLLLPIAWGLSAWQGQPFWPGSLHGWLVVAALAVVTQSLGQGSITYALTYLPVGLSATTLLLQPMLSTLGAWLLFHARLGPAQLAGGVVLLGAIWLARRASSRGASGSVPARNRRDP